MGATWLLIGILIGLGLGLIIFRHSLPKVVGSLRVDHSDPDSGPYLFMEIDQGGMSTIQNSNYIILKVNLKSYISQD